jgi:hypothetical protein
MHGLFNLRMKFNYTLNTDININKIIKSIKKLNEVNDNLFIIGKCLTSNVGDKHIYIDIKDKNMTINFSHIYYDGFSIFLITHKIDQIYKGEIENHIFNIYDPDYSKFKVFTNSIKLLPKVKLNSVYHRVVAKIKNNKKRIKILKTKFNEQVSTKEIIYYLMDKIKIKNYCFLINARKGFSEYDNYLGNLIYFSHTLNKTDDIRNSLQEKKEVSLETKITNTFPNGTLVNSYLNFTLPSFIKYLTPPVSINNVIFIHPRNNDEKYILVDYCY